MLEELEQARKKALKKQLICFGICIVGAILLFPLLSFTAIGLLIPGIIVASLISHKDIAEFEKIYKQNIVVAALKEICTDVTFDYERGISREIIASTNMMNMGDTFYSNDYITGKYKNINFELSDVEIQEETTDSDGDTHTYTLFKGQWYIFDFNKEFKANIKIKGKGFTNSNVIVLFAKKEDKFKKVELEDTEFNKLYKVYAQNELDAFYILTPNMMTKIKEVGEKIHGKLLFCFIDNRLHIAVHNNKDLFEASIYKKINIEEAKQKTQEEISAITDFVNILSLDNDLFKK